MDLADLLEIWLTSHFHVIFPLPAVIYFIISLGSFSVHFGPKLSTCQDAAKLLQ
jgi:hypothetical protein